MHFSVLSNTNQLPDKEVLLPNKRKGLLIPKRDVLLKKIILQDENPSEVRRNKFVAHPWEDSFQVEMCSAI